MCIDLFGDLRRKAYLDLAHFPTDFLRMTTKGKKYEEICLFFLRFLHSDSIPFVQFVQLLTCVCV